MRIVEENWKVLASLFPTGWQQMAWQSGAVERLRRFPSPDVLLRMLMLHGARGGVGLLFAGDGCAREAGELDRHFGCRLAQTPAQQRGVATFVVIEIASGKRRIPVRRQYQSGDPDCGWHDRQRARQDGEQMEDSVQHQTAEFGV